MTSRDDEQTITAVTAHVREAIGDLSNFVSRAELAVAVVVAMRDALFTETTSGGAPEGRDWEVRALDPLRDAAERYLDEATRAARAREAS
ncbi:hypothetical protein [Curtobacterium sp. 20TX0008]|uniref:hypothetical protein n=1 Tax=Curtobacterium sp. 20TX0008 TaxID=3022018 RepID=UPI00232C3C39|nr:hypothetical protein [Curtobacterium sp. 20TX0008]MDB6427104.1 hypothetical protein [Curtobacterium sp. 20TX0008]